MHVPLFFLKMLHAFDERVVPPFLCSGVFCGTEAHSSHTYAPTQAFGLCFRSSACFLHLEKNSPRDIPEKHQPCVAIDMYVRKTPAWVDTKVHHIMHQITEVIVTSTSGKCKSIWC